MYKAHKSLISSNTLFKQINDGLPTLHLTHLLLASHPSHECNNDVQYHSFEIIHDSPSRFIRNQFFGPITSLNILLKTHICNPHYGLHPSNTLARVPFMGSVLVAACLKCERACVSNI